MKNANAMKAQAKTEAEWAAVKARRVRIAAGLLAEGDDFISAYENLIESIGTEGLAASVFDEPAITDAEAYAAVELAVNARG